MKKEELKIWIIKRLFETGIINLNFKTPSWSTGQASPIYFNFKRVCAYPDIRRAIIELFMLTIQEHRLSIDCVLGIPAGGIAYSTLIAFAYNIPSGYIKVRKNQNKLPTGTELFNKRALIVEDIIIDGKAMLDDCKTLLEQKAACVIPMTIFDYGKPGTQERFLEIGLKSISLFVMDDFMTELKKMLKGEMRENFLAWSENPAEWSKKSIETRTEEVS